MDTTTTCPDTDYDHVCNEHNINVWECECNGAYCKHGTLVPGSEVQYYRIMNRRLSKVLQKCSCGRYKYETLEELRPDLHKKSPGEGEERPGNWYLVTLTQPDTDKTVKDRIKAANKIIKSKQVSPEQWCYSLELTAKGTPHVHIALFTYKYPEYRVINKFNDGHRVDIQREKYNVKNYVVKNETKPSPELLATWGLDSWFFCSNNYSGPRPNGPESPSARIELVE